MSEINASVLNYPKGAGQVRDLIREMLKSQVDPGTSMDTGGRFGSANLWAGSNTSYPSPSPITKP